MNAWQAWYLCAVLTLLVALLIWDEWARSGRESAPVRRVREYLPKR